MSMITLTKKAFVDELAGRLEISKKDATDIYEQVFAVIKDNLVEGNRVDVSGFGRFEVRRREARAGYNPKTREKIQIPASNSVSFKPSKALKDDVNK